MVIIMIIIPSGVAREAAGTTSAIIILGCKFATRKTYIIGISAVGADAAFRKPLINAYFYY